MRIVGVHDHANLAARWIDEAEPYSWLRAFENLGSMGHDAYALLAERDGDYRASKPIRNLNYVCYKEDRTFDFCTREILEIKPDILLLNICWYGDAAERLTSLRHALSTTKFVIRIHHDVRYLWKQPRFQRVLGLADVIIVPTMAQSDYLLKQSVKRPIHVIPFGINKLEIDAAPDELNRDIDLISFANSHPARNLKLVNKLHKKLRKKGFVAQNYIGLPRQSLIHYLKRSKFMLLSSLTEASGSRVMLEAMEAGCSPICFEECETAVEVLKAHECGTTIQTVLRLKMPQKKVSKPLLSGSKIQKKLEKILLNDSSPCSGGVLGQYDFYTEIKQINDVLLDRAENE